MAHTAFDLFPFSIYTGWMSVAAIADISYYLIYIERDDFGISSVAWTIVLLIAATILAFVFSGKNRDWCYPLVFVWAFIHWHRDPKWCGLPGNHRHFLYSDCSHFYRVDHDLH
ncbi:hypothetical protein [Peribacillus simplex]|uniref:hypothetical protein n=1 Tax=Peribacillus simplex TaxID=1478 RepID=UPI0021AA75EF|nr:hypothetical protein [Peribacillus simplex]